MESYIYGVIYGTMGERLAFDRPHTEPPIRGGTLASVINELVGRGWEYVSLSNSGNYVVCIVRRPKEKAAAATSAPPPFPA